MSMSRIAHRILILTFFSQFVKIVFRKSAIPAILLSCEKNAKFFHFFPLVKQFIFSGNFNMYTFTSQ